MRSFLYALVFCLFVSASAFLGIAVSVDGYFANLTEWIARARTDSAGDATARLFRRAVDDGIIVWDAKTRSVALRRDVVAKGPLYNQLFRVGEAGATIARELQQSRGLTNYLAIRVHFSDCAIPCKEQVNWVVEGGAAQSGASSLALGASLSRQGRIAIPSQRLHAQMSRDAEGNYADWQAWAAQQPLAFSTARPGLDAIDIVGRLVSVPNGWKIVARWCRSPAGRLVACQATRGAAVAFRLQRVLDVKTTRLVIAPASIVPSRLPVGRFFLSDRLVVDCKAENVCVPVWRVISGRHRYARVRQSGGSKASEGTERKQVRKIEALDPWVHRVDNTPRPTPLVFAAGAEAIIGEVSARPGSVVAKAHVFASGGGERRLTLDADIQTLTHTVFQAFIKKRERINPQGNTRQASLVVLDLRKPHLGAIRAAVGVPRMALGRSSWDISAAAFDARKKVAPGSPAWTGRASHHTPGSSWKLLTALALIDAVTSGTLPLQTQADLQAVLQGVDAREAGLRLGPGLLDARHGICPPKVLSDGLKGAALKPGADTPTCGPAHHAVIRDSGRGSVLSRSPNVRFGLTDAITVSSNIWFVTALLRAETDVTDAKPGAIMERTAKRLGLLAPAALDSGLGLGLDRRDAASIDVLADRSSVQKLAFSSFGQTVQAGPLVLAQLAASVATGLDVRPALFQPFSAPKPLFGSADANSLLVLLRQGMRNVVGLPAGTADHIFNQRARNLRKRVGGKTGTAQRNSTLDRISTFTGWLDDRDGKPAFAIACSSTVRGRRSNTGKVKVFPACAHLSAELMRRLDEEVLAK